MYRERQSSISGSIAWTAESDGTAGRVLPDGCMDLLWLGGHLVVAGPDTSSFLSWQPAGAGYAGLRFAPGLGPSVLGIPAHAVRDTRVRLDALWAPAEVRRLEEQVAAARSVASGLEEVVARQARGPVVVDPALTEVVRRARRGDSVETIAPAIGLSTRQLQRRALHAFGYGPKLLARILRFGDALALARRGVPLAAVAAQGGYADQAHLANDVRSLAGTTLGQLGLGARAQPAGAAAGSAANRSTGLPSGSRTVA
jgi:AraC-like DNA-binding protein